MISFHDIERVVDRTLYGNPQIWSIVGDDGTPIINFKTLLKAEYKSGGKVVAEPIEENSFATYNKTSEPMQYYFEVALQGASTIPGFTNNNFAEALTKLEELKIGTELFTFVTPFKSYSYLSLEGYSTAFETSSSMIIVGLQCVEVREVQQGYTNVTINDATPITQENSANPSNSDTVGTGITETQTPTDEEKKQVLRSTLRDISGTPII